VTNSEATTHAFLQGRSERFMLLQISTMGSIEEGAQGKKA
jgi:hypothetical protein